MTDQIVALLIAERDKLTRAIDALQSSTGVKRRGRHPRPLRAVCRCFNASRCFEHQRRQGWNAARQAAHSAQMKAYWAKRRAGKK